MAEFGEDGEDRTAKEKIETEAGEPEINGEAGLTTAGDDDSAVGNDEADGTGESIDEPIKAGE